MTARSRGNTAHKSQMKTKMALGDFLVAYLKRAGVRHIFGLPGDLVLGLFHRFGADRDLEIETFSHEPTVGYAADGYTRSTRRLGVVCVTYGAGGHNIVNAVAGAYAEQIPLLVVSGGPGEAEQRLGGIHHQAKHVGGQLAIFEEITCESRLIVHPERAAEEIHALVGRIVGENRPGYLEIHRDLVDMLIPVPEALRSWKGRFPKPRSDRRKLREAVADAASRLRSAKKPVLFAGIEIFRENAEAEFLKLAEELACPVVTTMLAKGVFPMHHPQHMGIHMGPFSPAPIARRVKEADLVLALGTQLTDMNLGASEAQVSRERSIWAIEGHVNVSYHQYTGVTLPEFIKGLRQQKLPRFPERVHYCDNLKRSKTRRANPNGILVNDLLLEVNDFLKEHHGYNVFAESGDMLFGGLELRLFGGLYMAQGYYASMGFAIPAAMGAEIGTGVRPLVLCGDGSFQMTGPEISHAPRKGLAPIVVLVNNAGWSIFRPVSPRPDLLEVPAWPYAELAEAWGGLGLRAETPGELRAALETAHQSRSFALIDCRVPGDSLSPISRKYIEQSARKGATRGGR